MPRARSPARDKAFEIFKEHRGNISNRAIANMLDVPEKTVGGWKCKDNWDKKLNGESEDSNGVLQKTKRSTPKEEKSEIVIENDELTDKQKLFCFYYVKYWNATKAYQKAYDCSYTTAMTSGSRLSKNAKVSGEIDRLKAELFSVTRLDTKTFAKALLQKHIDIAFADITDFLSFGRKEIVTSDGGVREVNFVHLKKSDEIDGSIINEIKEGREGVSIKLANREKSLDFLSKHYDLLGDEDKKTLQTAKLYYEVAKAKKETESSDGSDGEQIIFVDSKEAMERYIDEHGDANGQSK